MKKGPGISAAAPGEGEALSPIEPLFDESGLRLNLV